MKTESKNTRHRNTVAGAIVPPPGLERIEELAGDYKAARSDLTGRVTLVEAELAAVRREHLGELRDRVGAAAAAEADLLAAIAARPDLFARPKTRILHGIKVGWKKQKGKTTFEDAEAVVKRIRRLLPRKFKTLVKVTETPIKDALARLSVADIKKLGVTVADDTNIPFVAPVDSETDKIVEALLTAAKSAGGDSGGDSGETS